MRKSDTVHLRAVPQSRNGRPSRRTVAGRASAPLFDERPRGGFFRRLRRIIGEVFGMALVLALSIVLAHAMLVLIYPV
jgi:hypothetical protein